MKTTKIEKAVSKIIEDVKKNGDKALLKYSAKFDGCLFKKPSEFLVSIEEIENAYNSVEKNFIISLRKAVENIRFYHEKQKPEEWFETLPDETLIGMRNIPLDSVGVYVPSGRAPYPSTVLMNVIPAQIAGVKEIIMVTPPSKNGKVSKYILAAAKELGIFKIFKIGGAQAIAALAYGTKTIPKVDKIVGPGNIFVTIAKKLLYGIVGIDKLAGPSDVVIIADELAEVKFIAYDMAAQAEHDPNSKAILITTSKDIKRDVEYQLKKIKLLKRCKIILVDSIDEAVKKANEIAPEHLELMVAAPQNLLEKIENAGAVFLGPYSPVAVGDYIAGPNHVLPTDGTARFSSPLGVYDFVKKQSVLGYTKTALLKYSKDVINLANVEGFKFHAKSIEARLETV